MLGSQTIRRTASPPEASETAVAIAGPVGEAALGKSAASVLRPG